MSAHLSSETNYKRVPLKKGTINEMLSSTFHHTKRASFNLTNNSNTLNINKNNSSNNNISISNTIKNNTTINSKNNN